MIIKGKVKVIKYLPDGVNVEIETDKLVGRIKLNLPVIGVRFEQESPFEIEIKEIEEPKPKKKEKKEKVEETE